MKIYSGEIQNYKAIQHIAFESKGKSIIIQGKNGSGKSSVLETLTIAFLGKKAVPVDAIRLGEESSIITWNLGNDREVQFTITVTLSGDDYKVTLHSYFNGKRVKLENPATFLKSLIIDTALDPQSFFTKSDKEQVQALCDILPGLKEQLDNIDAEYKSAQEERSIINREGQRLKVQLEGMTFYPDAPEKELDPAALMAEKQRILTYNSQEAILQNTVSRIANELSIEHQNFSSMKALEWQITEQIDSLTEKLRVTREKMKPVETKLADLNALKDQADKNLSDFEPESPESIDNQILTITETNRKVAANKLYKEKEAELEQKRKEFSEGLEKMRSIEDKRVNLFKTVQMPITGLSVGDGCLMYPDPNTGNPVRIKSLSTGQQWAIIIPILAAYLPPEEKGLRAMIIKNLNDLDKDNQELMFEEARKAGVQLIMHQTVFESDNSQCEIIIKN